MSAVQFGPFDQATGRWSVGWEPEPPRHEPHPVDYESKARRRAAHAADQAALVKEQAAMAGRDYVGDPFADTQEDETAYIEGVSEREEPAIKNGNNNRGPVSSSVIGKYKSITPTPRRLSREVLAHWRTHPYEQLVPRGQQFEKRSKAPPVQYDGEGR